MKTRRVIGAVVVAATVTAVGAGVAIAAQDEPTPGSTTTACPYGNTPGDGAGRWGGTGPGAGPGMGPGMEPGTGMGYGRHMGQGPDGQEWGGMHRGFGPGAGVTAEPAGELTSDQKATLALMAEEEKLAQDLYAAFAAKYDDQRFDRIGAAETQHLTAVRSVLDRYDLKDPTEGLAAGKFKSEDVQALYDKWLEQGSESESAALAAAADLERQDVAELQDAAKGLDAPDVEQLYVHLQRASQRHLEVFTR